MVQGGLIWARFLVSSVSQILGCKHLGHNGTYLGHNGTSLGHIGTYLGHNGTYLGHIGTHLRQNGTYLVHVRTYLGCIWMQDWNTKCPPMYHGYGVANRYLQCFPCILVAVVPPNAWPLFVVIVAAMVLTMGVMVVMMVFLKVMLIVVTEMFFSSF